MTEYFILSLITLLIYMIPFVIAYFRDHCNKLAIFWFSVFFSWTGIGWLIGIVWAASDNVKKNQINPY